MRDPAPRCVECTDAPIKTLVVGRIIQKCYVRSTDEIDEKKDRV